MPSLSLPPVGAGRRFRVVVKARPVRSPASAYQLAVFGDTLGSATVDLIDGEVAVVVRLHSSSRRLAEALAASWAKATLAVVGLGDWTVEALALDELPLRTTPPTPSTG